MQVRFRKSCSFVQTVQCSKTSVSLGSRVRAFGDQEQSRHKARKLNIQWRCRKWCHDLVKVTWRAVTQGKRFELDAKTQEFLAWFRLKDNRVAVELRMEEVGERNLIAPTSIVCCQRTEVGELTGPLRPKWYDTFGTRFLQTKPRPSYIVQD